MSNPQILIDLEIVKLFVSGTDEDRATIKKLYPQLNMDALREHLLWELLFKTARGNRTVYNFHHKGKDSGFVILPVEDDKN